ncbi:hypothetical protein DNU06_03675 [Putridiphycobacter roseus]|uniref:Cell shape-determining protein MreC n=1 Tax=Putridiphycobacter roseus TaxID=2219161 RepID=A0A2W1N5P2_9FLAO|nr:rod shape-determining protein MreC [Putridiphycobacter roseus]PZE18940.1 hypothetical protein DNU06_03675 [Putridiphycobacter roseus]
MRNLFKFLKRFRNFLIFMVLQIFVLGLFFNSKNYHKASFVNSTNAISSWFLQKRYNITRHFDLEKNNVILANENAELLGKLPMSYYALQQQLFQINDSVYEQQYQFIAATVINFSNHKLNNFATINKGSLAGVEKDMGVIVSDGIIGFVIDVSKHYAIIRTLLSERINIIVEVNDIMGSLDWNGRDNKVGKVKGITSSAQIVVGDTVYTKGSNGHFPIGIPVGVVSEAKIENGAATLSINIDFTVNFSALGHVYIIKNIFKMEKDKLEHKYYE